MKQFILITGAKGQEKLVGVFSMRNKAEDSTKFKIRSQIFEVEADNLAHIPLEELERVIAAAKAAKARL